MSDVEVAEAWLASLHVTLWADWDITRPDRRKQAAEWFLDQMQRFHHFHFEEAKSAGRR